MISCHIYFSPPAWNETVSRISKQMFSFWNIYWNFIPLSLLILLSRSVSVNCMEKIEKEEKHFFFFFFSSLIELGNSSNSYLKAVRCCVTCHIDLVIIICIVVQLFLLAVSLWVLFTEKLSGALWGPEAPTSFWPQPYDFPWVPKGGFLDCSSLPWGQMRNS